MKDSPHRNYTEIIILDRLLEQEGIPHEIRPSFDGYILGFPDLDPEPDVTATENMMTYNAKMDLLEIKADNGRVFTDMSAEAALPIFRDAKSRLGIRKWKGGRRSP